MTERIKCIIIEDEKPASDLLQLYISKVDILQLSGTFTNCTQAMTWLAHHTPDLIFTDINLPGINGLDFIRSLTPAPNVIFTTAHGQYAVDGFNLDAVDFLLKPILFERFLKSINRFIKWDKLPVDLPGKPEADPEPPFIFIRCDKKMVKIYLDDILYLEAQKNYIQIKTNCDSFRTYLSISEMEEKLPETKFVRIHRSFIISLHRIGKFSHAMVEIDGTSIPIGRHYAAHTLQLLNEYRVREKG
ncbi:LytTR family DNA-binding domain-containing protein [Chitinophaga sp.]|uniref:LytR/AlgR family response regulator transcription factor n=1 Tax=Chitinophaga sp. TaxID=1869181 RepID=UPI0031E258D3